MPPRIARLAGLGAYGACVGMLAVFGLLIFGTRATPQSGITSSLSYVTWIALAIVFALLIGAHVFIARQLMHIARGGGPTSV